MEEHGDHVGESDNASSDQGSDDTGSSDYLESLRARFDELASRIEAATQESLERTHSLLTEPADAAPGPAAESPPKPAAPAASTGTTSQTPASTDVEPPAVETTDSRFRAPPPMLGKDPQPAAPRPPIEEPVVPVADEVPAPAPAPPPAAKRETVEPIAPAEADVEPPVTAPDPAPVFTYAAGDEMVAGDADLDAWDETAPPLQPDQRTSPRPPSTGISDPTTLGAELRSNVHPVTPVRSRRAFIIPALVVVLLAAVAVGAWMMFGGDDSAPSAETATTTTVASVSPSETTPPVNTEAIEADAQQALASAGFDTITVTMAGDTAVIEGTVESEEAKTAAGIAVLSVDGVTNVDSLIAVVVPPPPDPGEVQAAAEDALIVLGLDRLSVAVADGVATIRGSMPLDGLSGGYFAYTDPAREALLGIDGIDQVRTRLELRGFQGDLQDTLDDLVAAAPITFAIGSAELTPEAAAVLDDVAVAIIDAPGLGVIVAGSFDPADDAAANQALAQARADVMVGYLVAAGVTEARLGAAPYGERRFEVLP